MLITSTKTGGAASGALLSKEGLARTAKVNFLAISCPLPAWQHPSSVRIIAQAEANEMPTYGIILLR
jgi:hypothetical protein